MFVQAYEQLKDVKTSMLRPKKLGGNNPNVAFEVIFTGSTVQGLAGPYRAFFEDISKELQPTNSAGHTLGMFIPSPNQ